MKMVAPFAIDPAPDLCDLDHLNRRGAEVLTAQPQDLWRRAGWPEAHFWIEPGYDSTAPGTPFAVNSNLMGGLPPASAVEVRVAA